MLADAVEQPAGRGHRRERVRGLLLARERLARLLRGRPQRVGEAQARLLGGQSSVLARLGGDRLDLSETEPEQVGLPGSLPGGGHHLVELGLEGLQPGEELAIARREV